MPVAGEPFIYHQLRLLSRQGARRVVLCVGHLGEQIAEAVGDGRRFGLDVDYAFDGPEPVGTAGALRQALPLLGDAFLVTYGDAYLRDRPCVRPARVRGPGSARPDDRLRNDGAWGESNAVYGDGLVSAYDKRVPPAGARWIDYGLLAFESSVFRESRIPDLSELCSELASAGQLAGFVATERFYEIGTPEALLEVDELLRKADPRSRPDR